MSSKRRKRRGAVDDEIEHEESTSTHILSSGPIMIKETETETGTETEEREDGGMTYGQLNMLAVVLSERREDCPQIPIPSFPLALFIVTGGNEVRGDSQVCLFCIKTS